MTVEYEFDVESTMRLVRDVAELAMVAGKEILKIYQTEFNVKTKQDSSPVTEADVLAESIITKGLSKLTPDIPVIGEEWISNNPDARQPKSDFWLVDPIDGTKEFVKKTGQFTINIGLILNQRPALGVVFVPVPEHLFLGGDKIGTYLTTDAFTRWEHEKPGKKIKMEFVAEKSISVAVSEYDYNTDGIRNLMAPKTIDKWNVSGGANKFCSLLVNESDYYPRIRSCKEWDSAAGHALLLAAGGELKLQDGNELLYGKENYLNPPFIANRPINQSIT